ncbi:MAG TPA: GntR family transcriptional regulator [Azospirillum sp.]|nr:GntR family transcriptional regulator [Azospirillum sp.]
MPSPLVKIQPLDTGITTREQVYGRLKRAIIQMDIYDHPGEIRLDERKLSGMLGTSRTPIRLALTLLEREGLVRQEPRRGIFIVRKTKTQIIEMIVTWAALESMATRLAAERASDEEIRSLWSHFRDFEDNAPSSNLQEYADANIEFHKAVIRLSGSKLIQSLTDNLFIHMRVIRKLTIVQDNRADHSINEHRAIIRALEQRDVALAERLSREHVMGLAAHVEQHVSVLFRDERDDRAGTGDTIIPV